MAENNGSKVYGFCCHCLDDYIPDSSDDHQCPCHCEIAIPDGEVNGFIFEFHNKTIGSRYDIPNLKCDVCKNNDVPKFWCQNCEQNMCDSCKSIHDNFTVTQKHMLINLVENTDHTTDEEQDINVVLKDLKDVCEAHRLEPVQLQCKDCSVAVCVNCFIFNHNGHEFLDLRNTDIQQKIRENFKSLKEDLENQIAQLESFSEAVSIKLSANQESGNTASSKVDSQVRKICDEVKYQGEELKNKIRKTCNEEKLNADNLTKAVETFCDKLKYHVKESQILLEQSSILQVLNLIPVLKKYQIDSKNFEMPEMVFPWFHESAINKQLLSDELGRSENLEEHTFVVTFNLGCLVEQMLSSEHEIGGLSWSLVVEKRRGHNMFLGIRVGLKVGESVKANLMIQLINKYISKLITKNGSVELSFDKSLLGW